MYEKKIELVMLPWHSATGLPVTGLSLLASDVNKHVKLDIAGSCATR
jgi:hypothetical protein